MKDPLGEDSWYITDDSDIKDDDDDDAEEQAQQSRAGEAPATVCGGGTSIGPRRTRPPAARAAAEVE